MWPSPEDWEVSPLREGQGVVRGLEEWGGLLVCSYGREAVAGSVWESPSAESVAGGGLGSDVALPAHTEGSSAQGQLPVG